MKMGCSKKDPFPTHRGNFHRPKRVEGNHLKVLNLYRMSGEGGIVNFPRGGGEVDLFWNDAISGAFILHLPCSKMLQQVEASGVF